MLTRGPAPDHNHQSNLSSFLVVPSPHRIKYLAAFCRYGDFPGMGSHIGWELVSFRKLASFMTSISVFCTVISLSLSAQVPQFSDFY